MDFYVYILRSKNHGSFYIGQTQDIDKRLNQHNSGRSRYTKAYRPYEIFAFKKVETRRDAIKMEKKLKNIKSSAKLHDFLSRHDFSIQGTT